MGIVEVGGGGGVGGEETDEKVSLNFIAPILAYITFVGRTESTMRAKIVRDGAQGLTFVTYLCDPRSRLLPRLLETQP